MPDIKLIDMGKDPGIENAKFKVSDGTVSYDEVKNFFPISRTRNNSSTVFLFWDDVVSYTSIGLVDFLNVHLYKKENFEFYLSAFLERNNDFLDGVKYSKRVIETNLNITVSYDKLQEVLKENYNLILQHSPTSGVLFGLGPANKTIKKVYMCFKYKCPEIPVYVDEISKFIFNSVPIECTYLEEVPLKDQLLGLKPTMIFGGDAGYCMKVFSENNIKNIEFVCNTCHNGLDKEFLENWSSQPVNITAEGYKIFMYDDTILNNGDPSAFLQ